ncbi:hypothetical protein SAMN04488087_0643 [Rhodothermus profundi]|uniref:Uncharacterized protein n=1 Tax=Rhodothermus profundi TaxID=633813 RepID=A0A1M6QJA0_9BACT|nr:hypothetical protein SAMN04488087_0643 [Rhodothermus profundi]
MYNIIQYNVDTFIIIRSLSFAGILSAFLFILTLIIAAFFKSIEISIHSFKEVIFWSLILSYYAWSFSFLAYDHALKGWFDMNEWNMAWILFVLWFFPFLGMFYLLHRKIRTQ